MTTCPACGAHGLSTFYEVERVPVHSCRLMGTLDEAEAFPTGALRLAVCSACGFVTNTAFDPSLQDYAIDYEETQGFSPRFVEFTRELAERWVDRYDLRGKEVLEIGSGKGEFLVLLCELGVGRGVGMDPAFVPERVSSEAGERIEFVRDLYSERYGHLSGDAIVCRHTLEHIHPVAGFMRLIRRSLEGRRDAVLLFDLPDLLRVLREGAFWDVYYEHTSYFSPGALARLFRREGFRVLDLELAYDGQYIVIEARAGEGERLPLEEEPAEVAQAAEAFGEAVAAQVERWRGELRRVREAGGRSVIWGGGSKGVSFLTTTGAGADVDVAVDVNPYKQGKFIAGTGHRVVGPEYLRDHPPELVIAMNPIYLDEIGRTLSGLGVEARLTPV
jgi:SAM-dependent methyltransferase